MKEFVTKYALYVASLMVAIVITAPAAGSLVINVQSVNAMSGSTNNALDVSLMNTGPGPSSVGAFSFEISATSPLIIFTSATYGTKVGPYIFSGSSFDQDFGLSLSTATGTSLEASDLYDGLGAATIAPGATLGLGRILFNIAPGTAGGSIPLTLAGFPFTSFSDAAGGNLLFTGNNGTVTVTAASEPTMISLLVVALGLMQCIRRDASDQTAP